MKKIRFSKILSVALVCLCHLRIPVHAGGFFKVLSVALLSLCNGGDVRWIHKYNTSALTPKYDVSLMNDTHAIVSGRNGNDSFLGVVDNEGEMVWENEIEDIHLDKVLVTGQQQFFLVGKRLHGGSYPKVRSLVVMRGTVNPSSLTPLSIDWAEQVMFGTSVQVHDVKERKMGGVEVIGDVYGGFSVNETYTLKPRGFLVAYDNLGVLLYVRVVSNTLGVSHSARSLVHETGGIMSIVGWTTEPFSTSYPGLPTMTLVFLNTDGPMPSVLLNYVYLVIEEEGDQFSPTFFGRGIIPMQHARTSKNTYFVTGVLTNLLMNDTTSFSEGENQLFIAEFTQYGVPLFVRALSHPSFNFSTGLGVIEDAEGNCLAAGYYHTKNGTKGLILVNALEAYGTLVYAKSFSMEGYDISGGFGLNKTSDGHIWVPGVIKNESGAMMMNTADLLLMKLGQEGNKDCGELLQVNLDLKNAQRLSTSEVSPHSRKLWSIEGTLPFQILKPLTIDAERLCSFYDPNPAPKKSPISKGGVSALTLVLSATVLASLWVLYAKKNDRTIFSSCCQPCIKNTKECGNNTCKRIKEMECCGENGCCKKCCTQCGESKICDPLKNARCCQEDGCCYKCGQRVCGFEADNNISIFEQTI